MKYALGNMLNGAGGLNPDGLALDLQFAADKTLTARRGPTPVLTRGSTGTFVGSNGLIQSAGNNVASFDHDPVTLASRGLLIEEGRTNLLQRSEEFDVSTYWGVVRTSISANQTSAPDGTNTADKLITDTTATSNHRVDRAPVNLTLSTVHTFSVFAKASEYTGLTLGVALGATEGVRFSLVGAGTATPAAGFTGTIQQLANGWYRCTCTFTSDAATTSHRACIFVGQNGTTFTYTGDGTSGIFIWGAQLEAGSFATSYIPTTTSALARSADVCSITGANFTGMWNASEGSLFTSAIFNAPVVYGTTQRIIDINDTTTANTLRYFRNPTSGFSGFANTSNNNLNVIISGTSALQPFITQKYSAGFKLDDYAFYINNSQVGTDNLGAMPISPTTMVIGDNTAASPRSYLNGTISAIRYYRKRLVNAKLASLTV